jgi:hypothetical protein
MGTADSELTGIRLTFFQLIQKYRIQIPIIQRDYAQGRSNAKEIRIDFLDALYDYLLEGKPNRDLDFIYGNLSDNIIKDAITFIPLDGQQRLTTLFLLHWYLANNDMEMPILRETIVYKPGTDNQKSKFTYETRASSREFCDALMISNIDLNNLLPSDPGQNNSLSKTIAEAGWYFLSWKNDPTIKSMLIMLDAIHERFHGSKDFFKKLTSVDNPVITFQFLDLDFYNLTDDLYIKMNARGIPLTPFEQFKANVEKFIKKSEFNKKHTYDLIFNGEVREVFTETYFSHRIDTDWANLFWSHTGANKKEYDGLIMNFIRATVVNHSAGITNNANLAFLMDQSNKRISFLQYSLFNCIDEKYIIDLIAILDLLKNGNNKVKEYLPNFYYYDENQVFDTVIKNTFRQAGYTVRIQFHAFCQYLIKWGPDRYLPEWMRVIHNLSENTLYNNETDFINSITSINSLLTATHGILDYLASAGKITGFDKLQVHEERIKAILILKKNGWEEQIYPLEQHGYFKGQIGFLIFSSGIFAYFEENSNCDWSVTDDDEYKKAFVAYGEKSKKIFDDNGLMEFDDYLWERTLLSKIDYLVVEGSNQSFLIDNDRDISWKRLLKGDKNPAHQPLIKEVLDELELNDVVQSLTSIKNKSTATDWRRKFIDNHRLFNYLGPKRYVRKESRHGFVLFTGERMSGAHAELFSYSFYLGNLEKKIFIPFELCDYYDPTGDEIKDVPCAYLNNWEYNNSKYAIDISYSKDLLKYILRFFYRDIGNYNEGLIVILERNGFEFKDDSYILSASENDILPTITSLCTSFQNFDDELGKSNLV